MTGSPALPVLLVDPSLFTAPYDAALTEGLVAAGVDPMWATRPTRSGDRQELPLSRTDAFFYRRIEQSNTLPRPLRALFKGLAHVAGLATLLQRVRRDRPSVVHVQWIVVPPLDALAFWLLRRWCPVVLTVHDTVPYNGQKLPWLQRLGHDLPARLAHHLIVHTRAAKQTLVDRGLPAHRISVIPHGPLRLASPVPPRLRLVDDPARAPSHAPTHDPRWTFVLFGEIKPYKGLDVLIEAMALLPEAIRVRSRVVVAGRPRMDIDPLLARIRELDLTAQFDLRLRRLSEDEMAALFGEADSFVFPYHQIDASGVYFLVKSLGRWLVASRVGIFAEDMAEGTDGALAPPGDAAALARELQTAIVERPRGAAATASNAWSDIGKATRAVYERVLLEHARTDRPHPNPLPPAGEAATGQTPSGVRGRP